MISTTLHTASPTPPRNTQARHGIGTSSTAPDDTNQKNMLLLIQLRWIAVIGQFLTIALVELGLHIPLPYQPMLLLLVALVLLNLASYGWLKYRVTISNRALLYALMLDVVALTVQLYFSGGIANPFIGLYLLQITLGAVLLNVRSAWSIMLLAAACLLLLTQYHMPLSLSDAVAANFAPLHTIGLLVCYGLDAALMVIFISRISHNLRHRELNLAELKQRAAEESNIVRMGLLASGAAHELGTPLASVAVILSDWRRMPTVADQPELLADIDDMQVAIQRCKAIVTGILTSFGETRGEAPAATTVNAFLETTVDEWRTARACTTMCLRNEFGADLAIVSDSTLQQVVANLLDNAWEASPRWLELHARRNDDTLVLQVVDHGPGFAAPILEHFGEPYQSTKGRLGGGMGLFLVVNVVRQLGGTVVASNPPLGGASVTVTLPLDTLRIHESAHE